MSRRSTAPTPIRGPTPSTSRPEGTYTLTAAYSGTSGLPTIVDSLTLNGNGSTIVRSSTPGTPEFRIVYVSTSGSVTLSNITFANGRRAGDFQGGAIRTDFGTLLLVGCTVSDSSAAFGGGIYNYRGTLNVDQSLIVNNVSDDRPLTGGTGRAGPRRQPGHSTDAPGDPPVRFPWLRHFS